MLLGPSREGNTNSGIAAQPRCSAVELHLCHVSATSLQGISPARRTLPTVPRVCRMLLPAQPALGSKDITVGDIAEAVR